MNYQNIQSNKSFFPTISEETKSFKISVGTILSQSSIKALSPFSKCTNLRIVADFKELNHSQDNSGQFEVSLSSDNEPFLRFLICFEKRNSSSSSQMDTFNTTIHPESQLLNSNVTLQESSFGQFSSPVRSTFEYTSISHNYVFNKSLDQLDIFVRVENQNQMYGYKCSASFGSFERTKENIQSCSNGSFLCSEQEDKILPEEERDASDLSTTKSEWFIAPQIKPRNQRSSKLKSEETKVTNKKRLHAEENSRSSSTENVKKQNEMSIENNKFDKKNVVKNFVKAFDGYFMNRSRDNEIMKAFNLSLDQLNELRIRQEVLEKSMRYNNRMIISMIFSNLKEIFEYFLRVEAPLWINNSSVFDKQAHRTILKDYLHAAARPKDIPKIVNLRIRNRNQSSS